MPSFGPVKRRELFGPAAAPTCNPGLQTESTRLGIARVRGSGAVEGLDSCRPCGWNPAMKPVRFSRHARENTAFRGTTESEVVQAIRAGTWQPAERGRQECRFEFPFDREWNGRMYAKKQVRPVFVEEPDGVVIVTVYVYYVP